MNIKTEPTLLSCGGLLECMDLCEAVQKKHRSFQWQTNRFKVIDLFVNYLSESLSAPHIWNKLR